MTRSERRRDALSSCLSLLRCRCIVALRSFHFLFLSSLFRSTTLEKRDSRVRERWWLLNSSVSVKRVYMYVRMYACACEYACEWSKSATSLDLWNNSPTLGELLSNIPYLHAILTLSGLWLNYSAVLNLNFCHFNVSRRYSFTVSLAIFILLQRRRRGEIVSAFFQGLTYYNGSAPAVLQVSLQKVFSLPSCGDPIRKTIRGPPSC